MNREVVSEWNPTEIGLNHRLLMADKQLISCQDFDHMTLCPRKHRQAHDLARELARCTPSTGYIDFPHTTSQSANNLEAKR